MEPLIIDAAENTPSVRLDAANNVFEISGRSHSENVVGFFKPILDWFDDYAQSPNDHTVFCFKFTYFNTASSKLILDIIEKLREIQKAGKNVTIKWYYLTDDDDMEEAGIDYAEIADIPIEMVEYQR